MPELAAQPEIAARPATAAEAIRDLARRLREAGIETPEQDARLLVLWASGLSREAYILAPETLLPAAAQASIAEAARRRLAREPVSRIIGRREFWGRSFELGPATLDPRADTETLVEAVLSLIDAAGRRMEPLRLLDLGTGTGCILLSLLAELPKATGVGVDIDPAALAVAGRNAAAQGLESRALFCCGDWAAQIFGSFDGIVANPPYIRQADIAGLAPEVRLYDPRRALDGGPDGFDAYRRIVADAHSLARPGTLLALEAGAGQMSQLIDLLVKSGWTANRSSCRVYTDLAGLDRVVAVRKQE
jgi:release factor glutamine methyltransferase